MNKNKRGISPLIATVLIVGFTIAIAALVFIFLKQQVNLTAKKGGLQFSANEESQVQFSTPACTYSGNGQLQLTIRNDGSLRIDCFWIAPKGRDTQLIAFNLKPAQQDVLGLNTVWATYNAETNNE